MNWRDILKEAAGLLLAVAFFVPALIVALALLESLIY
jgi:hypothetical protein